MGVNEWLKRRADRKNESVAPAEDLLRLAIVNPVKVVLIGKTGSGKSSIVRYLTGSPGVQVGDGYKSCTPGNIEYGIPMEQSLVQMLDTRGLGEAGYDAAQTIDELVEQADMVVATIRLSDMNQEVLLSALKVFRSRRRPTPVLVVQTCIHELYSSRNVDHPTPYIDLGSDIQAVSKEYQRAREASLYHKRLMKAVSGPNLTFVQIDFTASADGFLPADFGGQQLCDAFVELASQALRQRQQGSSRAPRPFPWPWGRHRAENDSSEEFARRLRQELPIGNRSSAQ